MRCQSSWDNQQNVNSPAFNRLCYRPQQNPLPLWEHSWHAAGVRVEVGQLTFRARHLHWSPLFCSYFFQWDLMQSSLPEDHLAGSLWYEPLQGFSIRLLLKTNNQHFSSCSALSLKVALCLLAKLISQSCQINVTLLYSEKKGGRGGVEEVRGLLS